MSSNRKRGFRYERVAADIIQSSLKFKSNFPSSWWAYRIPLSSGVIVITGGTRQKLSGDVIVGCDGYGVTTVEIKSRKKRSISDIFVYNGCRYIMCFHRGRWRYFCLDHNKNKNGLPLWEEVDLDIFLSTLVRDIMNNCNREKFILIPKPND